MRKLMLNPEALEVESFHTSIAASAVGTVGAHTGGGALEGSCDPETCQGGGDDATRRTCPGKHATCPNTGCGVPCGYPQTYPISLCDPPNTCNYMTCPPCIG